MSAPNPQANAAAAQPDAQPAIYETDIWAPPAADGLLHHLHKPMPAPEPLPELDSEVCGYSPLEPDPAPEPEADPDPEVGGWSGWSDQAMLAPDLAPEPEAEP